MMLDDGTEAHEQAVTEAGDRSSQNDAAPERHQPSLSEAMEELIGKFQIVLHLPSAQVWNPGCNTDTCLLPVQSLSTPQHACVDFNLQSRQVKVPESQATMW